MDRPANKRRFLTVKNEEGGGMKGTPIETDDKGNLITSSPTPPPDAPKFDPSIFVAFVSTLEKRLTIPGDIRSEIFRSLSDAMGRLNTVLCTADMAQPDRGEGNSTLIPVLASELGEVGKAISELGKKLGKVSKGDDETPEPPPPTPPPSDPSAALLALTESLEKSLVEKRGAKMSKERLRRFKDAMDTLGRLIAELEAETPKRKPAAKSETPAVDVSKAIDGLTGTVEKLVGIVQRQGRELKTIRESRPASNVIPVDQSRVQKSDDVSWPYDMNDAKKLDKATSF